MALSRPGINFVEGSNVTIATADNPGLEAVDVTISSTSSGAAPGDTACWMPLTTTVGGDDVLVFDADHSLIPTLIPF